MIEEDIEKLNVCVDDFARAMKTRLKEMSSHQHYSWNRVDLESDVEMINNVSEDVSLARNRITRFLRIESKTLVNIAIRAMFLWFRSGGNTG